MTLNPTTFTTDVLEPQGPSWLVEERDACGVGFLADRQGRASHQLVKDTLTALSCMEHRGGCCADQESGDGAGIMTAIPWTLLQAWADSIGAGELSHSNTGVAMVFLPQAVVTSSSLTGDALERSLFLARRRFEKAVSQQVRDLGPDSADAKALMEAYVCSFSGRTIVYKGMVRSEVLGQFYQDLQNPDYQSAFAVYHRRFSTNTLPKWPLAHPMRLLGHNGEINTLRGNINWLNGSGPNDDGARSLPKSAGAD